MKSGRGAVIHYSSMHEKTLPDGFIRCPMELLRASLASPQRTWTTEDSHTLREILNAVFYLLKSGSQWRLCFPMTSLEMAHRLSLLQTMALREGTSGKRSIALSVNALGFA
jgi:hypothetical protein